MGFEYEQETRAILGACFEVINELGDGFLESVYQNALLIALRQRGLRAISQYPLTVHFHDQEVGHFVADILVEDKIIVELKAVRSLQSEHKAQVINYLKATRMKVGLLVNFGNRHLEFFRLDNQNGKISIDENKPSS